MKQPILRSGVRYVMAGTMALLMTFVLLWGMQKLIAGGENVMTEPVKGNVLDFIRLEKDQTVVEKNVSHKSHLSQKSHHRQWSRHLCNKQTPMHRPHVLCVDTGRSSETAKAHRG
eukprot:TRINITY_DN7823_c0_g1_i1.p1 TRINITY_DN7823_c0_g1~~TRINITY_DN7823_c0_g1_i1.p1  ORF type:complete len:115 (+),score=50.89 TRINITY_DN7823_c0_g1_i1:339-683(+)